MAQRTRLVVREQAHSNYQRTPNLEQARLTPNANPSPGNKTSGLIRESREFSPSNLHRFLKMPSPGKLTPLATESAISHGRPELLQQCSDLFLNLVIVSLA